MFKPKKLIDEDTMSKATELIEKYKVEEEKNLDFQKLADGYLKHIPKAIKVFNEVTRVLKLGSFSDSVETDFYFLPTGSVNSLNIEVFIQSNEIEKEGIELVRKIKGVQINKIRPAGIIINITT